MNATAVPPKASEKAELHRWLTLFQGIRPLSRAGASRDALAGFQLAAMNIPQALGYTKIAGTPVVTGFYTLLLPLLAFAVFGSSRYLVVAADSATAAILAGRTVQYGALGQRAIHGTCKHGRLTDGRLPAISAHLKVEISGRLPLANRAGQLSHRSRSLGRDRRLGDDA